MRLAAAGNLRNFTQPGYGRIGLGISAPKPGLSAGLCEIEQRGHFNRAAVGGAAMGALISLPIPRFQPASKPCSGRPRLRRRLFPLFLPLLRTPILLALSL